MKNSYHCLIILGILTTSCVSGNKIKKREQPARAPVISGDENQTPPVEDRRNNSDATPQGTNGEDKNSEGDETKVEDFNAKLSYKLFSGNLSQEQIEKWVSDDKANRIDETTQYRYAYIPQEFLKDKETMNRARIALSKALNHVAVAADDIHHPVDVSDGYGVVFAIFVDKYWGKGQGVRKWEYTAAGIGRDMGEGFHAKRMDLVAFDANKPVAADRLVYNLLHGNIYNELIDTPIGNTDGYYSPEKSAGAVLKQQLDVWGAKPTAKVGVQNAITFGPRFVRRFEIPGRPGGYWESMDDFDGVKQPMIWLDGRIPSDRDNGMLDDFDTVASETWYHMKNGLPAYFVFGNTNQQRARGAQTFVIDPLNNNNEDLVTGFCVFCHMTGVQSAPNDMAIALEEGKVTSNLEVAKQYWTQNVDLQKQYDADRKIVTDALGKVVIGISDGSEVFNKNITYGIDGKEPCYFITQYIRKGALGGQTDGYRHRNEDGSLGPQ